MGDHSPGDLVVITVHDLPTWGRLGMVTEVIDCGPKEGVYYDVRVPARAPHPYKADEIRPATDDDKATHHPSWLRALAEDWQRQRRVEAELADTDPQRSPRGWQGGDT